MKQQTITKIMTVLLLAAVIPAIGQTYTLDDCIRTALQNNQQLQNSRLDEKETAYKIGEVKSGLLPTVALSNQFQYYTHVPGQYAPASNFGGKEGEYVKMRLTMPQTMSSTVQVSQSLFNKQVFTGLQAAREGLELSRLGTQVTEENLVYQVSSTFYTVQVLEDNQKRLYQNIVNLTSTVQINAVLVKTDIIASNVHNRLLINLENLRNQYQNQQLELTRNKNMLKYLMNMGISDSLALAELEIATVNLQPEEGSITQRPDIRLQESQLRLSRLDRKTVAAGYFPVASIGFATGYTSFNSEFAPGKALYNDWINTTSFSLSMKFTLFDGMLKRSQLRQKDVEIQKNTNKLDMMKLSANREVADAQENYRTHHIQLKSNQTSLVLAENLFATSKGDYENGLTSVTDFLNAQTDLSNARTNYSVALLNYKLAELSLKKANGTLIEK